MMGQPAVSLDPVGAGPLRMVALLANPRDPDYPALNLGTERQKIEKVMSKVPGIAVEFFPGGRGIDLEDALRLLQGEGIDLAVGLEIVGGGSRMAIVMNRNEFFDRRGYLDYLVQAVRNARPGVI